jgi:hypothetical protein
MQEGLRMITETQECSDSAATWSERAYLSEDLRQRVARADILLVPDEGYLDRPELRFFPSGTDRFFDYLKREAPPGVLVEACVEDNDYNEVDRHAAILYIASAVVTLLAAPLFVRLLGDYISRRLAKLRSSAVLKTSITFHDPETGRSVHLSYDGPAQDFRSTALAALKSLQQPLQATPLLPKHGKQNQSDSEAPPKLSGQS